jgi:hypothetical protein
MVVKGKYVDVWIGGSLDVGNTESGEWRLGVYMVLTLVHTLDFGGV